MMKLECDVCGYQSETASDFCRVNIRRYRSMTDYLYGREESKDICYSCCQKLFEFDIKAPVTDSTDLSDLELSVRAYNCLKRAGYRTYGDIKNLTFEEGMKIRNLGKHSLEEVLAKIKSIEDGKNEHNNKDFEHNTIDDLPNGEEV